MVCLVLLVLAAAGRAEAAPLLAPAGACAGDSDPAASIAVQERAMRCLHAYARERAELGRLARAGKLDASAGLKSQLIVRCRSFSHTPCGRAIEATFRAVRYGSSSWRGGENLAWGAGSMGSARAIFARWLASPAHRPNIVHGSWRDLGVDLRVARGLFGLDRVNVWVAHFGKP